MWGLRGDCAICVGSLGCVEWHVWGLGYESGVWGGVVSGVMSCVTPVWCLGWSGLL